ncbi:MAG TPA: hypothetical protein VHD31_02845 [Candidatus Paceibacterota bacterium]|nr:hypothetical protein [Candidatus Paceibacterota bacterium]
MENEKDVASMEEMGISCRIFKGSNLTFLGSLAIDVKGNTPTYKVTIYEFCDDNHVSWYHWEYENIRY